MLRLTVPSGNGPALGAAAFDRRLDPDSDAPLVVALSGGGDSLALLALTADWARAHGRTVIALTVDHHLQPESSAWSRRAAAMARGLGADWRGLDWTGPKPAAGLPAAARRARHALIAEAAREAGARVVLFAQTRDDVAEGEVMRDEGSTLGRLAEWAPSPAWPEGRGVFVLRPLLEVGRDQLRRLLEARGLDWIEDPANADPRYARARARAFLSIQPRAAPTPQRTDLSAHMSELAQAATVDAAGVLTLAREDLEDAPLAFLAAALVCAAGAAAPPRGERLQRLAGRIEAGEVFTATLAGARIEAGREKFLLMRDAGEIVRGGLAPIRVAPRVPAVWDGRFEIETTSPGEIRPLKGLQNRLPARDRAALAGIAPAARPAIPVFVGNASLSPTVASGALRVQPLAAVRLRAACGVITHERKIDTASRGAGPEASLCWRDTAPERADRPRSE